MPQLTLPFDELIFSDSQKTAATLAGALVVFQWTHLSKQQARVYWCKIIQNYEITTRYASHHNSHTL